MVYFQQMVVGRTRQFVLCLCLLLAACADSGPIEGEITLTGLFKADFELIDQFGKTASDERFEGKPMLIYFGFTTCPDVCPAAVGIMSETLDGLGSKAADVAPLFITVDPERDTPERLRDYLAYDGRIIGLTGGDAQVVAARDAMLVYAKKVELPDSAMAYTMDHQRLFYVTDKDGVPKYAIPDSADPKSVIALLRREL